LIESKRVYALDPANPDASSLVANVLHSAGRHDEALQWLDRALELRPDFQAVFNKAISLRELGRLEESLVHFNRCNELQPNSAPALLSRANLLLSLRRFEEALDDYRQAHEIDPTNADTCNNIGTVLCSLDRDEDALQWYDCALRLRPDFITALLNKAVSLGDSRRVDEALSIFALLKANDPENAHVDWNLSLLHLRTGNLANGWPGREARWRIPALSAPYPRFTEPLWLGVGAIEGKIVFVWAEEGLGDIIQFARYVPMLAERGARVILSVPNPAVSLLSGLPGISQCVSSSAPARPAFDFHCPIGSLPLAFRTELETIPASIPYLPFPASNRMQVWQDRLGPHDKLRVGLVWSGNPEHKNDHNRSSSLRAFSAMLDVDATFFSLQKDPRPDDTAVLRHRSDIVDFTADLTDFAETAALISCLDLAITVDTSVAHLSGALGRPTWILLPYTPDWRWLLDRDDSPWYPTARLFRQSETREYDTVVDLVRDELVKLIDQWSSASKL
jgi:Flp pilus assembly protein TadD